MTNSNFLDMAGYKVVGRDFYLNPDNADSPDQILNLSLITDASKGRPFAHIINTDAVQLFVKAIIGCETVFGNTQVPGPFVRLSLKGKHWVGSSRSLRTAPTTI